LEKQNPEDSRF